MPPTLGWKRIAPAWHASPHIRHSTPRSARQPSVTATTRVQGTSSLWRHKAPGLQRATQSPQNVHSPRVKSTVGYPPSTVNIPVGHAERQSPQRVQRDSKAPSANAQGGRSTPAKPLVCPRRKARRLNNKSFTPWPSVRFPLEPRTPEGGLDVGQAPGNGHPRHHAGHSAGNIELAKAASQSSQAHGSCRCPYPSQGSTAFRCAG